MVARFIEIATDNPLPCTQGKIERLCDVPAGVDRSLDVGLSEAELNQELARLAAKVNAGFEASWGDHAAQARAAFNANPGSVDPDIVASQIKRDLFIRKATMIFVDVRGLDRDMVLDEANKIFPEGTVL